MMGMPKMDIAAMLGTMFLRNPSSAFWVGMMIHFAMGTVLLPIAYRVLLQPTSGGGTGSGVLYGLILWAAANLTVMPMMGAIHPMARTGMVQAPGFFMLNLGVMAPLGSLVGHLLYGGVLGILAGTKPVGVQPTAT